MLCALSGAADVHVGGLGLDSRAREIRSLAKSNNAAASARMKKRFDKNVKEVKLEVGAVVGLRLTKKQRASTDPTQLPALIVERKEDQYRLRVPEGLITGLHAVDELVVLQSHSFSNIKNLGLKGWEQHRKFSPQEIMTARRTGATPRAAPSGAAAKPKPKPSKEAAAMNDSDEDDESAAALEMAVFESARAYSQHARSQRLRARSQDTDTAMDVSELSDNSSVPPHAQVSQVSVSDWANAGGTLAGARADQPSCVVM
jgi:hypothetical protein